MLPQKKNADIAELARGKAGRLIGHLTGFLATLKGLPLAYNRDLQEDKEPLFDAVDQVERSLAALAGLLATATFDTQAMARRASSPALAATDLAEWLVQKGMPFREAHELIGGVVRESVQRRVPLPELVASHPALGAEAVALLEPGVAVSRRTSPGGAGPVPVAAQLERFAAVLRADAERLGMPRVGSALSHPPRSHAHGVGQQHDGPGPDRGVPVGPSHSPGPAAGE
jgi:argininosuccinate lyase